MHILKNLGVCFEVIGAFLLAVEAIKTPNMVKLTEKIASAANVLQYFGQQRIFQPDWRGLLKYLAVMTIATVGVLALLFLLILGHNPDVSSVQSESPLVMVWHLVVYVLILGPTAATILSYIFSRIARLLQWIERNITTGIVGIMGFSSYLISVIFREVSERL